MKPHNAFCLLFPGIQYTLNTLCLLSLLFLPWSLSAQSLQAVQNQSIDRLIFEPALINSVSPQGVPETNNPENLLPTEFADIQNNDEMPPLSREQIRDNIERYNELIASQELESGPFAESLFESLVDLGSQYQALGDHETAIEIFERAEYISRINNGLYHPEQITSIEKIIESYRATDQLALANQRENYLVYISRQHYGAGEMNTVPLFMNLASSNMTNFLRIMAAPVNPTIQITPGQDYSGIRGGGAYSLREIGFGNLFTAQRNYFTVLSTLLDNKQYFDPFLIDLEYKILETIFLRSFRTDILQEPDYYLSENRSRTGSLIKITNKRRNFSGYTEGNNVFERILIYIRNNPDGNVNQLSNTLIEYGDWNMLFDKHHIGLKKYREAFQHLKEIGLDQSAIEQVFNPAIPVHLPLFTAKPNTREKFGISSDTELEYQGYVDVEFTISKFGRAKRIKILSSSETSTSEIESKLRRYLNNSPFRPRFDEEGKNRASRMSLRYFFTFADQSI